MEVNELEMFLQSKIEELVGVLKIEMTKENVNEITYGDKLAALGGLNVAVATMKEINPDYKFDITDYYTPQEITEVVSKQQYICGGFGNNWTYKDIKI